MLALYMYVMYNGFNQIKKGRFNHDKRKELNAYICI